MMTEDEARTKWCPMAKVAVADLGDDTIRGEVSRLLIVRAADDAAILSARPPCIASDCAAWRWSAQRGPIWKDTQEPVKAGTLYRVDQVEYWPNVGCCGLAGPASFPAPRVPEKEDGR